MVEPLVRADGALPPALRTEPLEVPKQRGPVR
jgi:hypothetical protein